MNSFGKCLRWGIRNLEQTKSEIAERPSYDLLSTRQELSVQIHSDTDFTTQCRLCIHQRLTLYFPFDTKCPLVLMGMYKSGLRVLIIIKTSGHLVSNGNYRVKRQYSIELIISPQSHYLKSFTFSNFLDIHQICENFTCTCLWQHVEFKSVIKFRKMYVLKKKSIPICGKSNVFSHPGEASGSLSPTSQSTQLVIVTPQMECQIPMSIRNQPIPRRLKAEPNSILLRTL